MLFLTHLQDVDLYTPHIYGSDSARDTEQQAIFISIQYSSEILLPIHFGN